MFFQTMGFGSCSLMTLYLMRLFVLAPASYCDEKSNFKCRSGRCVSATWRCDGLVDCRDGSDEDDCPPRPCKPHQFVCGGGECLPQDWVCDGDIDCLDRSDEAPEICSNKSCPPTEFACGGAVPNRCVPKAWLCDGEDDCRNGADEMDCAKPTCSPDETTCRDGRCLARHFLCNGRVDCTDGSDESPLLCATQSRKAQAVCPPGEVPRTSGECFQKSRWCDGREDFHNGSDEYDCGEPAPQGNVNNYSAAVAAAVIVLVLLVLACAAAFNIFRKRRLLEVKTLWFDNPVYRKTPGGEELEMDRSPTDVWSER